MVAITAHSQTYGCPSEGQGLDLLHQPESLWSAVGGQTLTTGEENKEFDQWLSISSSLRKTDFKLCLLRETFST